MCEMRSHAHIFYRTTVRIYYFLNTEMVAFPERFKMLAGSPMTRSPDPNMIWYVLNDRRVSVELLISFTSCRYCQQGDHDMTGVESLGRSSQFPLERCWDFLRSETTFPSCWTGEESISETEGQMAYRDGDDCPDTHPVQLPKIVLEFVSGGSVEQRVSADVLRHSCRGITAATLTPPLSFSPSECRSLKLGAEARR